MKYVVNAALPHFPSWLSLLPISSGGRSHFSLNFESSLTPGFFEHIRLPEYFYLAVYKPSEAKFSKIRIKIKVIFTNFILLFPPSAGFQQKLKYISHIEFWKIFQTDIFEKTNKLTWAPSQDSDQSGHPPSLFRVFAVHRKKAWVLSFPVSAQRRLWSDWVDAQADLSLCWAHMSFCWFCRATVQM